MNASSFDRPDFLPPPSSLTPERLLEVLSLTTNFKLRRELTEALREEAEDALGDVSPRDPSWGEALLALLQTPVGLELFVNAAAHTKNKRLDFKEAVGRRLGDLVVRDEIVPPAEKSIAAWLRVLEDAGKFEDAAWMVWSAVVTDPVNREEFLDTIKSSPALSRQFPMLPVKSEESPLAELRRLVTSLNGDSEPDPEVLERISTLAAEAAKECRARMARDELVAPLAKRIEAALPVADAIARLRAISGDGIAAVEAELASIEAAQQAISVAAASAAAALAAGDFAGLVSHGTSGETARLSLETSRQRLRALLGVATVPDGQEDQVAGRSDLAPPTGDDDRSPPLPASPIPLDAVPTEAPDHPVAPPTDAAPSPGTASSHGVSAVPDRVCDAPPEPKPEPEQEPQAVSTDAPAPAAATLSGPTEPSGHHDLRGEAAFWASLAAGRLGLALALSEHAAFGDSALFVPALELMAIALVAASNGEWDDRARETAQRALDAWQSGGKDPQSATAAAALLLPASTVLAMLAPGGNQAGLISALTHRTDPPHDSAPNRSLPHLCSLADLVARASTTFGGSFLHGRQVLAALVSRDQWRAALERHCTGVQAWHSAQLLRQIRFAAATDVWHAMLRPEGPIGPLLHAVINNQASSLAYVRRELADLRFDGVLRKIEPKVRGRVGARRNPIDGPALRELEKAFDEGLGLIQAWVSLRDDAPSGAATTSSVGDFREQLASSLGKARAEIASLAGKPASASRAATAALDRLNELLDGRVPAMGWPGGGAGPQVSMSPDEFLAHDLLPIVDIRFDRDWKRLPSDRSVLPKLIGLAEGAEAPSPPGDVARARIRVRDFLGAELALWRVTDEAAKEALQQELHKEAVQAKDEAIRSIERARSNIDEAESAGRLATGQSQELIERIERLRAALERAQPPDTGILLPDVVQGCAHAEAVLRKAAAAVHERIKLRLSGLTRSATEAERSRIESTLAEGQFAIAEDFVERLEDGEPLPDLAPPPPVEQRFDAFFPPRAEALAGWLRKNPDGMRAVASKRGDALQEIAGGAKSPPNGEAAAIAEAWINCASQRGSRLRDHLLQLLRGIGFSEPELPGFATPPSSASEALFRVRTLPLRDRATAVLPEYGSIAGGNYNLLCLWQKRDAEDVGQAVARHRLGGAATIILFFGVLDAEQRRRLAAMARDDRLRGTLVLDQVLVLHLALLDEARLPTLFACTLPFSDSRPWADTGTPPSEMFFGRQRELRAVEARGGEFTHLIYGGRQLGKTALLRQVERTAGESAGTVALYISIAQIGLTGLPEDLWGVLADELAKSKVPIALGKGAKAADSFRAQVLEWLGREPSRRILLLLDEADEFFVKDRANRFPVTEALRSLAVETDRRFKPVFAGLRNVQKLARDPNSPLAHLGQPLVIGPLIRGQERLEAEALVRWPFAALGYRLSEAVIARILAFANYYPSLIQVVCQRLLRNLRQRRGGMGPSWQVQIDDVERVLELRELREAAFERFRITLELDERYRLLALLAADYSMDDPQILARGMRVATLHELAAIAWPGGFPADLGEDRFEALLDEMEGLGLLRRVDGAHYALRSANLAHLIGTRSEITAQIDAFERKPGPQEPDPLELRRGVGKRASIFTARQDAELLAPRSGALVVAGIKLARISEWQPAMLTAVEVARSRHDLAVETDVLPSGATFKDLVQRLGRPPDHNAGLRLLFVGPEIAWNADWIEEAQRRLAARPSATTNCRAVFIADAKRAWEWTVDAERRGGLLKGAEKQAPVVELSVGPWSRGTLELWLAVEDRVGSFPDWLLNDRVALLSATGGWDALIESISTARRGSLVGDAAKLRSYVDNQIGAQSELLSDVAAIPDAVAVLSALADAEDLRQADELVGPELVAAAAGDADLARVLRGLAWGELVGIVSRGPQGLTLNPLLRVALPRLTTAVRK